jgi:hypothetical protein
MNPYIEQDTVFHDFHHRFASVVAEMLVPQIRPKYFAKIDVDVYLHEAPAEDRKLLGRPEVYLTERAGSIAQGGTGALAAPAEALIPAAVDIVRLPYVEIREKDGRAVVTVIELLSPTNKLKLEDRAAYVAKRKKIFRSDAHLIEIDLLRGGARMPMDDLPDCDYYALVSRAEQRPRVGVWPVKLRERLPVIPVPLRAPDADAKLDLQAIVDQVYDVAGYEDYIYEGTPQPPLHPADDAWARELIAKGRAGDATRQ